MNHAHAINSSFKKLYLQPIPGSLSDQSHSAAAETTLLDNRVDELYEHMNVVLVHPGP